MDNKDGPGKACACACAFRLDMLLFTGAEIVVTVASDFLDPPKVPSGFAARNAGSMCKRPAMVSSRAGFSLARPSSGHNLAVNQGRRSLGEAAVLGCDQGKGGAGFEAAVIREPCRQLLSAGCAAGLVLFFLFSLSSEQRNAPCSLSQPEWSGHKYFVLDSKREGQGGALLNKGSTYDLEREKFKRPGLSGHKIAAVSERCRQDLNHLLISKEGGKYLRGT